SELAADLERARRFQQSLVPKEPVSALGWRVEGRLLTCEALGGDFYAAQADGEGLGVAVCDVVGHGVSAAMYAGMLRSARGAAWRRGAGPERGGRERASGVDFLEGSPRATLASALLLSDGRVRLWSAGHPSLLRLRAAGDGGIEPLASTGPLLHSLFRDRPPGIREVTLGPGDRLLALTDGAFEVRNPADQELGLPRLEKAFADLRSLPTSETLDALLDEVLTHGAGRPLADDVTLVLIERTGAADFASQTPEERARRFVRLATDESPGPVHGPFEEAKRLL